MSDEAANLPDPFFVPHIYYDRTPGLMIGISSMIGTAWWIASWFIYIKTATSDSNLQDSAGVDQVPLIWFWSHLNDNLAGWMAASYFSTFIGYLFVSFLELIAWIFYEFDEPTWLNLWIEMSFYAFLILLPSWLWAIVHITAPNSAGGLNSATPAVEYQTNSYFLFITNIVLWAYVGVIHIIYTQPLKDHIKSITSTCKCNASLPDTKEMGPAAKKYMEEILNAECFRTCPPKEAQNTARFKNLVAKAEEEAAKGALLAQAADEQDSE